MAQPQRRATWRRLNTAALLPGRVVAVEDRTSALEERVAAVLEEMRGELAEIRTLLSRTLEADADTTELVGRLLAGVSERLEALEEAASPEGPASP